ncbi:MAG: transglycosylase SLT domain-containing protein [Nitrospirae bacterium]|nr:transglycosylase SLT domain-containing protein [Nitrospirota bacterium]
MNTFIRNCLISLVFLAYFISPFEASAFLGELDNLTKASLTVDDSSPANVKQEKSGTINNCISRKVIIHLRNLLNPLAFNNIESNLNGSNVIGLWTGGSCVDTVTSKSGVMFGDYMSNNVASDAVNEQVRVFSRSKGGIFVDGLTRAASFMPILKKMLAKEGLPEDLAIVPLIESGYNNNAQSNGDEIAGPWQIMKWTARRFGLKIDYWVDERHDPIKSTNAATKYLKLLFDKFGSWELALAAYNSGEGTVSKALDRSSSTDFWSLYQSNSLSQQVYYYVHKFIAAREIAEKLDKYGYSELRYQPLMKFDTVVINPPADLSYIAKSAGTTVGRIKELNPELKQWCIPPDVKTYELRIPFGTTTMFLADFNNREEPEISSDKMDMGKTYIVKKGDTLYSIARKKRVPIKELLAVNKLKNSSHIHSGTVLILIAKNDSKKSFKKSHSKKRPSHAEV